MQNKSEIQMDEDNHNLFCMQGLCESRDAVVSMRWLHDEFGLGSLLVSKLFCSDCALGSQTHSRNSLKQEIYTFSHLLDHHTDWFDLGEALFSSDFSLPLSVFGQLTP